MPLPETRLQVGQVLAERYWLREHLGRGASGDVFRARHLRIPRELAIKVLHPHLVADPVVCARFEREAALAGRLRHENLVSILDVGETATTRYLVMELVAGPSLAALLADGPLAPTRVRALASQICDGLHHAHAHGLVHRDLKPDNVIVEDVAGREVPKIVDFGVAILRDEARGADATARLTDEGMVMGTPHYLSPEAARGQAVDHRSDLFALGVMLYELQTGRLPFDGDGVDVAIANLRASTPPMRARAPGVTIDPLLEALTLQLLAKDADARPASAAEVRALLDRIASDRAGAAAALGVALDRPSVREAAPTALVAPLPAPSAIEPERSTRELLRLARTRRSRAVGWIAALAIALGIAITLLIERGADRSHPALPHAEVTAPVVLPTTPTPAPPTHTLAPTSPSPPTTRPRPVVTRRAPLAPAPASGDPGVATLAPPIAIEVAPVGVEVVLAHYRRIGAELKAIADRRDLAVDDLWQRYRRLRIQQAIASGGGRADAMNVLTAIDRELAARFAPSPATR